ncbi:MAG: YtxH domain-containing protein [Dehalococcoidia bacterium]|nr:YtxH domain-containing protein [Dehalococcoidia bacterium]
MGHSHEHYGNMGGLGMGFILGAMVGIAIGMLYAPRAGIETRTMISDKADEVKEKVEEVVDTVKHKVSSLHSHSEEAAA